MGDSKQRVYCWFRLNKEFSDPCLYLQTMLQDTADQTELRVFPGPLVK